MPNTTAPAHGPLARAALSAIAAAAFLTAGATTSAQSDQREPQSSQSAKLSEQDRFFVQKVKKGGALQVALSTVEAQQGQYPRVREFAVETVKNMSQTGGTLHAIASSQGMDLPTEPPEDVKQLKKALAANEGELVDQEYIKQVLPASVVAVNVFEDQVRNGQNPKLVSFAEKMLPKLKQHKQKAETLAGAMGVKAPLPSQRLSKGVSRGSSTRPPGGQPAQTRPSSDPDEEANQSPRPNDRGEPHE